MFLFHTIPTENTQYTTDHSFHYTIEGKDIKFCTLVFFFIEKFAKFNTTSDNIDFCVING